MQKDQGEHSMPEQYDDTAVPQGAIDDRPYVTRPSWNVMLAQLAGHAPQPIRVSDFGRGSRVIQRGLSGDQEERDLDDEERGYRTH